MLLDGWAGCNALYKVLLEFLASDRASLFLHAKQDGDPAPYDEFLAGLRIYKADGPLMLRLTSDRWLELAGSCENLKTYFSHFCFEENEDSGHHHPDFGDHMARGTMRLIIEVDDSCEPQQESAGVWKALSAFVPIVHQ